MEINGRIVSIISEAVGGTNVDNCQHACTSKPCGPLAQCIPNLDSYECQCNPSNLQCNQAEEIQQNHTSNTMVNTINNADNINQRNSLNQTTKMKSSTFEKVISLTTIRTTVTSDDSGLRNVESLPTTNKPIKHENELEHLMSASPVVVNADDILKKDDEHHIDGSGIPDDDNDNDNDDDDDYYYYDDYRTSDSDAIIENTVQPNPSKIPTTTIASSAEKTTTSKLSDNTDDITDDNDSVVTRVFGRYMTVDTDKLLKKEKMIKNKKKSKIAYNKLEKTSKKHYLPMPLLEPQPPSLLDDEVEVDIVLPTNKTDSIEKLATTATTTLIPNKQNNSNKKPPQSDDNSDNDEYKEHDEMSNEFDMMGFYSNEDVLTTKELIDDMARIMKNGAEIRRTQMNHRTKYLRKSHGACFTGADR